jgi:hypothetical protein
MNESMNESLYVWAVTVSFYSYGVGGGIRTINVAATNGFDAIESAKQHLEQHHKTKLEKFSLDRLEKLCYLDVQAMKYK